MAEVIGEIFFRIIVEIFFYHICRITGWTVVRILTLGTRPKGRWEDQRDHGWISLCGLVFIIFAIALLFLTLS